ncbi:PLATZ transcription factor-domain-containing protein [Scenedesmus sp. NREL 46B-D3]|nr:PLATZ transcription factor-domain-containing protein [Scenedesmus sp. NREL 46B-D3]
MTELFGKTQSLHKLHSDCTSMSACCGGPCAPNRPQLEGWLHNMLHTQFFTPCQLHKEHKKNEATYFCADCGVSSTPLCGHCLSQHAGHRVIQIRRYVYCDVVRACDMSPHLDITGVQTYTINQAKVMFLNQRPQSKMGRPGAPDACHTCARTLREGCSYCSLACKLEALVGCDKLCMGGASSAFAAAAAVGSSGAESDCASDCWPAAVVAARAAHMQQRQGEFAGSDAGTATATDGDSSDSDHMRHASWAGQHAQHLLVGAAAAHLMRRHSDSDSDGRDSSGSYCSRRKQVCPRRSPLL